MFEVTVSPVESRFEDLEHGAHILVLNAHRKPPHIAMVHNGMLYSLEYSGLHIKPVNGLLRTIKLKSKPTLVVTLNLKLKASIIEKAFKEEDLAVSGTTCLTPIKKIVGQDQTTFIFELIPAIEKAGKVLHYSHIGLNPYLSNQEFKFQVYTKSEILNHIKSLKQSDDKR